MLTIEEIKKPIAAELGVFERTFKASMRGSVPLLNYITQYILKRKGKQMRPMFVLFSANICGGIIEATYRGAALVELLHTATLIHDDVVDNTYQRRGVFSINALWKNKAAVLIGDFLLSKGLLLAVRNGDFQLLKIVSQAVEQMSEGELLQIEKARKPNIDEAIYYEIIRKKTASLIASCCACGASSAGADIATVERMRFFGEKVGIAFQIKDDLLDLGYHPVGKPIGADINEKKVTLPLLYSLNKASKVEKRKIMRLLMHAPNLNADVVKEVIFFIERMGGLTYAELQMRRYIQEAIDLLSTFPSCPSRNALEQLASFTISRKN